MREIGILILLICAAYSGGMYAYLGFRTFRYAEDWEATTFHLGLCFIVALGFATTAMN